MAQQLIVAIDGEYDFKGDIFRLINVRGNFFTLLPLKTNGTYSLTKDGFLIMGVLLFAQAKLISPPKHN